MKTKDMEIMPVNQELLKLISPQGIEIKSSRVQMGEVISKIQYISGYPSRVNVGWLLSLKDIPNTIVSLVITPIEDVQAFVEGVSKGITTDNYTVNYEKEIIEKKEEVIEKEENENKVIPIIIVSGIGLTAILMFLFNRKNTYIYAKSNNRFKLIKMARLSNKNISIDISKCEKLSNSGIYAIKVRKAHFSKIKCQTITIINGKKKSDIVLWNNYYEIRL